ncbi:MAG TPA: DUF3806 domain-containing protein [Dermatophilaceae bacterium]|nr:DUF3806 domain-containing protein [Dermatophilaceae bacterium]
MRVGLFGRRGRTEHEALSADQAEVTALDHGADGPAALDTDDEAALRPRSSPITDTERARIAAGLAALAAEGVDVDDPASLGAGYDTAYTAWSAGREGSRPDHAAVVERYAIGVGEHLRRHTDLDWAVVTDVFGTDLGVAGGIGGSFVVVPANLVAARWMRGETGWLPGVVGHLVRRRSRR